MTDCNSGEQAPFCAVTTDEALPGVLGLLPEGPAWDAAWIDGTVQNSFWRSIASVVAHINTRLCAYLDEFFCASAKESVDQWITEYGLDQECDPFGSNLCLKATMLGGQNCEFYTELAHQLKWVIVCEDMATWNEPVAGCFECGCTPLGPTPTFVLPGANIGRGALCQCAFGEVVDHPEPEYWETTKTRKASCWVPGSNLGQGPDTDEPCCFICGWYELPEEDPLAAYAGTCASSEIDSITFDCQTPAPPPLVRAPCDSTGHYSTWGYAHHWRILIDAAASYALQGVAVVNDPDANCSAAGNFICGCTYLCNDVNPVVPLLCYLEKVKPAHTVLHMEVINA